MGLFNLEVNLHGEYNMDSTVKFLLKTSFKLMVISKGVKC